MKYQFIHRHRHQFPVLLSCRVLKVTPSGYYAWTKRPLSRRERENDSLLKQIRSIHEQSRKTYGSPRIARELRRKGYYASRQRVARIMRKHGIRAKTRRRFKVTTNSKHRYFISPNLLKQNFSVESPNSVWVSDITYIRTYEGWLYLTVIMDLFNREVVGWSVSPRLTAETTSVAALEQACGRQRPNPNLIFHSDKGIQFAAVEFRKLLSKNKMIQSMSGKGNCYDNAVAESFFHTLKTELVHHERYETRNQAKRSVLEYIEFFYNRIRLHSALDYQTPIEFKKLSMAA
jgi:putative transposase